MNKTLAAAWIWGKLIVTIYWFLRNKILAKEQYFPENKNLHRGKTLATAKLIMILSVTQYKNILVSKEQSFG
jgi:hypothetical protein